MLELGKESPELLVRPTLFERCSEAVARSLTWVHNFLARFLTALFTRLWHFQGRRPLPVRFFVGFLLMAFTSGFIALMLPFFYTAPKFITTPSLVVSCNAIVADAAKAGFLQSLAKKFLSIVNAWPNFYIRWNGWPTDAPEFLRYLEVDGALSDGSWLALLAVIATVLALLAALSAINRKKSTLRLMQVAWVMHFIVLMGFIHWTVSVPRILFRADNRSFDDLSCKELWNLDIAFTPLLLLVPVLVLIALLTVQVRRYYLGATATSPSFSSNPLIQSLKTGGEDPRFRSSIYWAVFFFVFVIVAPFLINGCGWEEYGIVKGSGEDAAEQVVQVQPKKPKKEKKLILDPWSPYILQRINIDDATIMDELVEMTRDTYVADTKKSGKLGKGGPGKGGWPNGAEGAKVRFIRLKYRGGNWDQEMGKSGDYNLLLRFNQLTGLPIAPETEARDIDRLARFANKKAPPFVFMTGSGGISITKSEAKILRDYCEKEGGMLFIDCGGGHFGRSVRNMLNQVFPGRSLVDIPNDDPIYQSPFLFPDGAPRFWHHDGNRALAIRHEGRIVCFYHPGDIKDAWKDGHSGVTTEVADMAYKLGVNVIYYAFNQYYRRHYEQDSD